MGLGFPGGIRIRPRPSETGGESDETGGRVTSARGVMPGLAVDGATDGAVWAGVIVVDGAEMGAADVVSAAPDRGMAGLLSLTNFFGGAFGGGVASDFIFCRVAFASS